MPNSPILVGYKELAELLIKEKGIHEGLWGIFVRFGLNAANVNFAHSEGGGKTLLPTALIPVQEIGIQRFAEATELTADASKVNPRPRGRKGAKRSPSKAKKR